MAHAVLSQGAVLRSVWLACVLAVAVPAAAWAQSAEQAAVVVTGAEHKVASLLAQRGQLTARYQQQLAAVDRLKKQKASWRRDRELNAAQADANDTAKRLTALDGQLHAAQASVVAARTTAVRTIDAELATHPDAPRATQLANLRSKLAPPLPAPKKIVIPDAEIDPLADPQELEQQAAAIAAVERQLEAQRRGLDQQQKDLTLVAELRGAHERAGELATRDDDQPQRGSSRTSSDKAASAGGAGASNDSGNSPSPDMGAGQQNPTGGGSGGSTETGGSGGSLTGDRGSFETNAAVALGEVIDRTTIDGLVRASRSGDPKQRAEAAKQARDAVARRLEQLQKKRREIEARARQLRGK
jgi:hypothetical protein